MCHPQGLLFEIGADACTRISEARCNLTSLITSLYLSSADTLMISPLPLSFCSCVPEFPIALYCCFDSPAHLSVRLLHLRGCQCLSCFYRQCWEDRPKPWNPGVQASLKLALGCAELINLRSLVLMGVICLNWKSCCFAITRLCQIGECWDGDDLSPFVQKERFPSLLFIESVMSFIA